MTGFDSAHLSLKQEKYSQAIDFFEIRIIGTMVCITAIVVNARQDFMVGSYQAILKPKFLTYM